MKKLNLLLLGCALASTLTPVALAQLQLQPLWHLDPDSRPYVTSNNTQHGLAYNPVTDHVLLVNRMGGLSVNVMNSLTGADRGMLSVNNISGGDFALNQIAVAEDGAIYAANLVASSSDSSPFKIYRWANESALPTLVYSGDWVAGTRWGDNMDIRGFGDSTQILFGQGGYGGKNRIAIFQTADGGTTFSPTTMILADVGLGATRGGVTFGLGDTFFTKDAGGTSLHYGTFDLTSGSASVTSTATLPSGLSGFGPLATAYLPGQPLLAAIQFNTESSPLPHNLYLFDISHPENPLTLDIEPFVNPGIQNGVAAGAVDIGEGKLFALDVNNGVRAYEFVPEPSSSTWVMLSVSLLTLFYRSRRRIAGVSHSLVRLTLRP